MIRRSASTHGSALVAILGLILAMICLAGYGLLSTRQAWRENASKLLHQTVADADMYGATNDLRSYVADQFASHASANLAHLPGVTLGTVLTSTDGVTAYHQHHSQSTGGVLTAIQSSSALAPLGSANDPFYGIRAATTTFDYRQTAALTEESVMGDRAARNQQTDIRVEVRQFPLSQFSQFSTSNHLINAPGLADLGRTHAGGNLTLGQNATAVYPLTVAGELRTAPGVTLSAKQQPDAAQAYGISSATTVEARRALMQNTVVDNDVLQSRITTAATLPEMLRPPSENLGSTERNAQKLSSQCGVRIYFDGETHTFTATRPSGESDPATQNAMQTYSGPLLPRANGRPVVEFDVARLNTEGSRWNSYYLQSNRADAVVIIRNAETLPRNLSLATPHDVWMEESFNTPSDPSQIRSASIVTSGRVIGVAE